MWKSTDSYSVKGKGVGVEQGVQKIINLSFLSKGVFLLQKFNLQILKCNIYENINTENPFRS